MAPEGSGGPLQVLATEHWSLLATRSLTYMESFSRVTMFLSILSGAVIALALLAQVDHFHETFLVAGVLILSVVVFAGIATIGRLGVLTRDDVRWVIGMNRLRHAYLELYPQLEPYFVTGTSDDVRGLGLSMGVPSRPSPPRLTVAVLSLQALPAMVMVIVAVVAGLLAALVAVLFGAPRVLAAVLAAIVFLLTNVGLGILSQRALFAFVRTLPTRFPSADQTCS